MRKSGLFLAIGFIFLCVMSEAADYKKMSRFVLRAQKSQEPLRPTRSTKVPDSFAPLVAFVKTEGVQPDSLLQSYGCRSFARKGDITIAGIPLNHLSALSDHPSVRRIEAGPRATICLDTTMAFINVPPAYTATAEHQAYTGKGVVVGLMDIGFDLTHPNFFDTETNHYRIGAFWDQLSKDTIGSPFPVGRDFTGYEAVRAYGHSTDGRTQRHGTHTLGIAAGSGYNSPYRGVAFESDICLVSNAVQSDIGYIDSTDLYKYTTAVDALGFKYLFDYADAHNMPCVVSFSEGYSPYIDSEDSLYAAFIDSLVGPGHILVASAGNENLHNTYAEKPAGTNMAGAFISSSKESAVYRIKADGSLLIHLYAYQDTQAPPSDTLTFCSSDYRLDSLITDTLFFHSDTCEVQLMRYPSAFDNDMMYLVGLSSTSKISSLPQIAIVVEGADCHAEIYGNSNAALTTRATDTRWNAILRGHNILAPGCFQPVICAGSTSYRMSVINYKGEKKNYSAGDIAGAVSPFSSSGPAINGLTKPDVVAPGANIISSDSEFYFAQDSTYNRNEIITYSEYDGKQYPWSFNSGTSMSAPFVAGVIALWLQAKPDLTPKEVMDVISRTSRKPDDVDIFPDNDYGYGEIDCYRGLLDILGLSRIEEICQWQPSSLRIIPEGNSLRLLFREPVQQPVNVRIYALSGALLSELRLQSQTTEAIIPLPTISAGIYLIQTTSKEQSLTGSQLVRL